MTVATVEMSVMFSTIRSWKKSGHTSSEKRNKADLVSDLQENTFRSFSHHITWWQQPERVATRVVENGTQWTHLMTIWWSWPEMCLSVP